MSIENTPNTIAQKLPILEPKQLAFVEYILQGEERRKAYKLAGYKGKKETVIDAGASEILSHPKVAQYLAIRRNQIESKIRENTGVTVEKVVAELSHIGFSDPLDLFDEGGNLRDIASMDDSIRRSIASIEVHEETVNGVKAGETKKIKFWNKNDALQQLGKYLGMFIEKLDIKNTVRHEQVKFDVSKLTNDDIAQLSNMMKRLPIKQQVNQ